MSRARAARRPLLGDQIASARARFQRIPPRKARLIVDLVRGLSVAEARTRLAFLHRPSAVPGVSKLLESAVANARDLNPELGSAADQLLVGEIYVDGGPMLKRFKPRAMGRANPIRKRTSHITIKLYEAA